MQRCPDCDAVIDAESINIREGLALCPQCSSLTRLSELIDSDRSAEETLSQPPAGCSLSVRGLGVVATASLRSIGGFVLAAAFALFWNGIVSVFVCVALAGLYTNLIGPLPEWFPGPAMKDGKPEMNGEPMGLGMTIFLCLFLVPFLVVGFGITVAALLSLLGKVVVVIDEFDSYVATGFGPFKWKRRFNPREVRAVKFGTTRWKSEGDSNTTIELTADRTINFGSMLSEERRNWLRVILKALLLPPEGKRFNADLPLLPWMERR